MLEETLLANMLMDESACTDALSMLDVDDFYNSKCKSVFGLIKSAYASGNGADCVAVINHVPDVEMQGYILSLPEKCQSIAQTERYCRQIKNDAIVRRIRLVAHELERNAIVGANAEELVAGAEKDLFSLIVNNEKRDFIQLKSMIPEVFDRMEERVLRGKSAGLSYSFLKIDEFTGGMHPGDFIVLSGRPGMGKTTLIGNMGLVSQNNVYLFETEMDRIGLAENILCSAAGVDSMRFRGGLMNDDEEDKIQVSANTIMNAKMFINDTPILTPSSLRMGIRRQITKTGKGIFVIDSLQNMGIDGKSRGQREDMTEITRSIKRVAMEFGVPIIALSHLTRDVDKRDNKRPINADLRESGSIEADADVILHMYRDGAYNKHTEWPTVAEIGIGKNRHGATKIVMIYCDLSCGKCDNLDNETYYNYAKDVIQK